MKKSILLIASAVLLIGCAEERAIEEISKETKREWEDKQVLTGSASGARAASTQAPKTWIYKATAVKTSTNGGFAFVGLQGDANIGYFNFTEDKLQLFNAVNSQGQGDSNSVPTVLEEWDITHHDYKLDDSSGKTSNREVEDDELNWSKKRYFKIDFAKGNFMGSGNACWAAKSARLVDNSLVMKQSYLTFVVETDYEATGNCPISMRRQNNGDYTYTVQWRYSFKPYQKTSYKPFIYKNGRNDELLNKYGYFNTYLEYLDRRSGRYSHAYLMNRWDPEKEHTFYFSKEFPEKHKWIFHDIFNKTNKLFSDNGLKIRFHLKENHKPGQPAKELGDIRYSFVNLVEERDPNAPLGYGPSDADPLTGEIFAANLHMYTGFLNTYIKRLKNSFDRQVSRFEESTLYDKMKRDLEEEDPKKWVKSLEYGDNKPGSIFNKMLMEKTYAFPLWARFSSEDPQDVDKIFDFSRTNEAFSLMREANPQSPVLSLIQERQQRAQDMIKHQMDHAHEEGHCKYPVHHHMADAQKLIIDGVDSKKVLDTIIYRTAIHELGHNLNLRHNFYGSVDKKNFAPARKATDDEGNERTYENHTSSVMEYLRLQEKIHLDHNWEPYDEAALLYAYSSGNIDSAKEFLFCTDEHRVLNAMCATWDYGSTPTEALFSHIETYEDLYNYVNFRNDRGYWNTSGYDNFVFGTMWDIKKFLVMYQSGYTPSLISKELDQIPGLEDYDKKEIREEISNNFKDAIKLAMVFYNSVLIQSAAEKDWRTQYEERSGEVKKIGSAADKIYAMMFLAGDAGFMYNPNRSLNYATYLSYINDERIGPLVTKIFENAINARVDMEQGFLGFGRSLYAMNATNYYNQDNISLIQKIGVEKFDAEEMEYFFGINTDEIENAQEVTLGQNRHPDFGENETVAIVRIRDHWYMAHKSNNPYSYNDMKSIIDRQSDVAEDKRYLQDLHNMYQSVIR